MNVISVLELSKKMESETIFILDVRTAQEFEFSNIGGHHIPLDELEQRVPELDLDKDIYCLCHHGVRSLYAANILASCGAKFPVNIEGGIDAWSLSIDENIKRY
jgi:rhodanese-related sulfurtransferase